jgi:hypothetical protein
MEWFEDGSLFVDAESPLGALLRLLWRLVHP